ncbi:LPD5 domain-containing protein [uncultured Cloacibacillus sp.]|uniref:LPD5 domain-containing protein n=1 Tax=uncultured Cloacibacillus sp. TaxID=889794 RepID=UPI00320AF11E
MPPSAARRRRKKDNLKQASLFPSEEEQRAEINSANTSSHRNQAEQVELYIRHILLSDETLLSQKYLVYKNLTREANTAAAVNWLRNIHRNTTSSWMTLPGDEEQKKAYISYDGHGISIVRHNTNAQVAAMKISWTHACDVLLDLIREREFISEEELSVRAGQPISSLPQIPQEDIDRIIMPPAGLEYNKNVVYEIVSENKGGDQTYDSIFIKNSYSPHAALQYHFRDGTVGRVEAGDDGVYIEKPGYAPLFVSVRQAYDRIAEFVADGTYYEKYYEDNRLLTHEAVDAILCMGTATAWGKEEIFGKISSTWDDETKLSTIKSCYPIGSEETFLSRDNADEAARINYDEEGIRIQVYDMENVGERGGINVEYAYLTWEEVKERIEKLIAEDKYLYETGPDFINDDGALVVDEKEIREFLRAGTGFPGAKNRIAEAYASGGRDAMEKALFAEYEGARYGFDTHDSGGTRIYNSASIDPSIVHYEKIRTGGLRSPSAKRVAVVNGISDILEDLIQRGTYLDEKDRNLPEDVVKGGRKITDADVAEICLADPISTREKIFDVFQKISAASERQKALKEIYGQSGHTFIYPSGLWGFVRYDAKGIAIEKAGEKASFSYAEIIKIIAKEIEKGTYITQEEREAVQERYVEDEEPDSDEKTETVEAHVIDEKKPGSPSPHIPLDYRITDENIGVGTPKERYANNIAAIKLLKELEESGRMASAEEQETLAKYVGWGGLAGAFDEQDSGWSREYQELKGLLTDEEYRSARSSTLTAFYTPPVVTEAIYSTLERLGFSGGNVLEPAMGTGHFFGTMPEAIRDKSRLYGVELDSVSGRIAKQLYQKSSIQVCGYEDTNYQDNFFDLAVGNVPFGQFKVADARYNKLNYSIHDYYFAKTLDKVRPGGVVAFITSRYTMDKENPSVRRYIAQRAELLGAVRLPNTAFKSAAGTEVVSDILFLQKRERVMDVEPEWIFTGKTEDGIVANEYFIKHPEMVCGNLELTSSAYGPVPTCMPIEGSSLEDLLANACSRIEGQMTEASLVLDENEEKPRETIPADPDVRNYSYTVVNGEVYYRENAVMYKPENAVGMRAERIKGLVALRDCTRELIEYQLNGQSDVDIAAKQRELRQLYDSFTAKYGIINSRGNAQAFEADSGYFLLCSLEELDAEGNLKGLADMFSKRTIGYRSVPTSVETAVEALAVSISERASIDLPYMSALCGKSEEEIVKELDGVIYKNPEKTLRNGGKAVYDTADEYLSGDILQKIRFAELAEKNSPGEYTENVTALEKVKPEPLTASEITARIGSPWIDERFVKDFIVELLEPNYYFAVNTLKVTYIPMTAEWRINGKNGDRANVNSEQVYGTAKANAYELIEDALNGKSTRVYKTLITPEGEHRELDVEATAAAQQKQEIIKQKFRDWIFRDIERREYLVDKYNRLFNNVRPREYDGAHIAFAGMNPEMKLEKHQRDAAARILYGPNTLLAHVVGAGKTFEMVSSAMESKRLGLCQKSMFVVPNHLTEQTASEFMKLYPAANILVATKRDFEKKNRKTFCSRIATGDYDAVILGFSQFEKIPMSLERQSEFIQEQIDQITDGITALKAANGERFSVKKYEQMQKRLQEKMDVLQQRMEARKDDVITFEELGVDMLFIDEAHNYKNLMTYTKMSNVAGISTTEAQKSADLYMKCRYMDEITGGRGIVFATGTPVSNSMVELFTMQRYLQMHELEKRGLAHFDAWASTFGETTNVLELSPDGSGYRTRTRFAKFFNLPELMSMFSECADIKTADMLNLPVPATHYENIVVKPSAEQLEMIGKLSERAEKIRNRSVRPDEDNMLKITSDGRKIGLDQRLMDDSLPDDPGSKVNACVSNVLRIWRETKEDKGTQLIFCDFSTPDPKKFNLYDDIKEKLIKAGVPENEIAFIHDADTETKKAALFAKVREGHVRVLMGSTQKMGAGTNVQDRLVASHDLDCPWRPADLEQRAGRIVRQGNRNKEVYIYRYVTERTFDAYLYQTIENKQKFIAQIMTSRSPVRSCEDVDESVLQYAEIKALCAGDPRIKEKMDLDIQVGRLTLLKSAYQDNRYMLEHSVAKTLPEEIANCKAKIKFLESDIEYIKANTHDENEEKFSPMTVLETVCTQKASAGQKILLAKELATRKEMTPIGEYRGMNMSVGIRDYFGGHSTYVLLLKREGGRRSYDVELGDDKLGNITRINNALAKIPDILENEKRLLAQKESQLAGYAEELRKPFEHAKELETLQARLNLLNAELNLDGGGRGAQAQTTKSEEDIRKDRLQEESSSIEPGTETHGDFALEDKPEKIEDFGEKIGGARKDIAAIKSQLDRTLAFSDDEILEKQFSAVFPEPNYKKLITNGMNPKAVAVIRALRETVPDKPRRSWGRDALVYTQILKLTKALVSEILDNDYAVEKVINSFNSNSELKKKVISKAELYLAVGHDVSLSGYMISRRDVYYIHGEKLAKPEYMWCIESKKRGGVSGYGELFEDAVKDFKKEFERSKEQAKQGEPSKRKLDFDLFRYRNKPNEIFIGKKMGREYVRLAGPFASQKEAALYRSENGDLLEERWANYKLIPSERRAGNEPRTGVDRRGGRDVTPDMFMKAFGFRGVEFGNYVEQDKRQRDLNEAYDALMDMADVISVPPKALSLNGRLGLAFGARGKGGKNAPKAHYEPLYMAINLTKTNGAGSLAHEWMHAVDDYFGSRLTKGGMMSESSVAAMSAIGREVGDVGEVRREMVQAFGGVLSAVRRDTNLSKRSEELDKRRSGKEYWSLKTELQSRAFEAYIIDKLAESGASNDYLANIVSEDAWKAMSAPRGDELPDDYPYPTKDEMPVIREAFDKFFEAIQTRETDKGVEMYSLEEKSHIFPSISIDDIRARIKGAEVTELDSGKIRLDFINGTKWIIDMEAAEIPVDPDIVRRDYGRDVKPDDVVSGRTRIIGGRTFIDLVAGMSDAKTFSHEVFEASWGTLTGEEQNILLKTYKSREVAADRYAAYLEGRVGVSSSAVSTVFQRLKDFFMDIRASLFGRGSEDIFRQIAEGKVHSRSVQQSEEEAVRYEIRDREGNMKGADEIIEKPVEEWTNAEADKVLEALDEHIATERARDRELHFALDEAPVGEKGKVIEAYERESEARKAETERAQKYVSKLIEWQGLEDKEEHKEESLMAEQERKTVTLAAGDDFIHSGYKHGKVIVGKIVGRVYKEEKDRLNDGTPMEQKVYSASFRIAASERDPGTRVRIRSTKPIDLSAFEKGEKPLLLTGQTFLLTPRDRDGHAAGSRVPVLFARSIHEAVVVKGQPVRGGEVVVSKDDAVQTEFFSAARENLTGYVYESKYNSFNKVLGQPEQPFGYESRFSVSTPKRGNDGKTVIGEDGKPVYEFVQVHCITREPMQIDDMLSQSGTPKLLSMKGAYQMYDVQRPDKSVARNVVTFEPTIVAKYKERTLEITVEKGNAPEVRDPNTQNGIYKGEITDHDMQNDIYFQRIGTVEYAHDGANLDKPLAIGDKVQVIYKDGHGVVREMSKDKELENER